MPHKDPEARKAYLRQWREQNLEAIKEKQKAYVEQTKDRRAAVNKARYERKKDAIQQAQLEYRKANRDKLRGYAKAYADANRAAVRAKSKERYAATRTTKAKERLLAGAKDRAKIRCLEFDLQINDVSWPSTCPVLGIALTYNGQGGSKDSRASLDRKNPSLGYTKNNVRIISMRANRIKSDATVEELRKILEYMESP